MEERGQQGTTIRILLGEITFMSKIILISSKVYFSHSTLKILSTTFYTAENGKGKGISKVLKCHLNEAWIAYSIQLDLE